MSDKKELPKLPSSQKEVPGSTHMPSGLKFCFENGTLMTNSRHTPSHLDRSQSKLTSKVLTTQPNALTTPSAYSQSTNRILRPENTHHFQNSKLPRVRVRKLSVSFYPPLKFSLPGGNFVQTLPALRQSEEYLCESSRKKGGLLSVDPRSDHVRYATSNASRSAFPRREGKLKSINLPEAGVHTRVGSRLSLTNSTKSLSKQSHCMSQDTPLATAQARSKSHNQHPTRRLQPFPLKSYDFPAAFHLEALENAKKLITSSDELASFSFTCETSKRLEYSSQSLTQRSISPRMGEGNSTSCSSSFTKGLMLNEQDTKKAQLVSAADASMHSLRVARDNYFTPLWLTGQVSNSLTASHRSFKKVTLSSIYRYLWWLGREVEACAMQQAITDNKEHVIYADGLHLVTSRMPTLYNSDEKDEQLSESAVEDDKAHLATSRSQSASLDPGLTTLSHFGANHSPGEGLLMLRTRATFATSGDPNRPTSVSSDLKITPLVGLVDETKVSPGNGGLSPSRFTTQRCDFKMHADSATDSTLYEAVSREYTDVDEDGKHLGKVYTNPSRTGEKVGHANEENLSSEEEEEEAAKILNTQSFQFTRRHSGLQFTDQWFEEIEGAGATSSQEGYDCSWWSFSLEAVTSEGLSYSSAMLFDPVSERYVFNGIPFREEARILHAPVDFLERCGRSRRRDSTNVVRIRKKVRMLLREYTSISKAFGGGIIVQTFSILPEEEEEEQQERREEGMKKPKKREEDEMDADMYRLIPPQKVRHLLWQCLPGAVTRAFTLAPFLLLATATKKISLLRIKGAPKPSGFVIGRSDAKDSIANTPQSVQTLEDYSDRQSKMKEADISSNKIDEASAGGRDLLAAEAVWRFKHPKLFKWAMCHNPAELEVTCDLVLDFLGKVSKHRRLTASVRRILKAVTTIQRFLRSSLMKKRRALQKMMRQWKRLEVGSRFRLQYYRPLCSASGQIETIVNNFLQDHMITSSDYKKQLIEELWEARRVAYREWVRKQRSHGIIVEQRNSQYRSSFCNNTQASTPSASGKKPDRGFNSMNDLDELIIWAREQDFAALSNTAEKSHVDSEAQAMSSILSRLNEVVWPTWGSEKQLESSKTSSVQSKTNDRTNLSPPLFTICKPVDEGDCYGKDPAASKGISFFRNILQSSTSLKFGSQTSWQRQRDELHERFGWFIPPKELLCESHQRLLLTLASSVLTKEQTQHEIQRALQEIATLRPTSPSEVAHFPSAKHTDDQRRVNMNNGTKNDHERLSSGRKTSLPFSDKSPFCLTSQKASTASLVPSESSVTKEVSPWLKTNVPSSNVSERANQCERGKK